MPECQVVAGLHQHPGDPRLVEGGQQVGQPGTHHDREVHDREVDPQQRRRPQQDSHPLRQEAQPVRDRRRQRVRRGAACQLRDSRVVDDQTRASGQRVDQLGEVQRVSGRPVGQPQQVLTRLAAGQCGHQLEHRRFRKPAQPEALGRPDDPAQRPQIIAARHRAQHADQEQRELPDRPGEPTPHRHRHPVGPLQLVDHQHGRPDLAELFHQGEQLLGGRGGQVGALTDGGLAAQQLGDGTAPGIRRGCVDL